MTEKLYESLVQWYEDLYCDKFQTEKELHFLEEILKRYKKKTILDVGCGTGRHVIGLVKRGFDAYGLDKSKEMITIAKNKINDGEKRFFVKDMRKISSDKRFDVILSMFTTFAYLTNPEDILTTLKNFYKILDKKGILLLDTVYLWPLIAIGKFSGEHIEKCETSSKVFIVKDENKLDLLNNILFTKATYKRKLGMKWLPIIKEDFPTPLRLYTPDELTILLRSIGFKILGVYGDFNGNPLSNEHHKRLIVLAQKI